MRPAPAILGCLPLLFLLAAPVAARAEVFLVPLPGLTGTYDSGGPVRRTVSFQLPGTPAVVRGVSLRVVGSSVVGQLNCSMAQDPIHPWPAYIAGWMEDPPNSDWNAQPEMPIVSGPFDLTAPFLTAAIFDHPAGTWGFLADGGDSLIVIAGPGQNALDCSPNSPVPTVSVAEAWLVIDADIPVPAGTRSWGQVKAIYR
jgi:hypothetical protein